MKKMTTCIECRGKQHLLFSKLGFQYYRCENCTLVSTYPLPTNKTIEAHYKSKFITGNYLFLRQYAKQYANVYKAMAKDLVKYMKKYNASIKGKRTLDIGCFTGEFPQILKRMGANAYGIELQHEAVKIAKKKLPGHVIQSDVMQKLPVNHFYCITLLGLVEHVTNPAILLKRTYALLDKGGFIMIQTPDSGSLMAKMMQEYWPPFTPVEHIHISSEKSIHRLLTTIGFKDIYIKKHYKFLPLAYVFQMLSVFGPSLQTIASPIYTLLPTKVTEFILPFYIGEMIVIARK